MLHAEEKDLNHHKNNITKREREREKHNQGFWSGENPLEHESDTIFRNHEFDGKDVRVSFLIFPTYIYFF